MAKFLRSREMVAGVEDGIAVLLLHTEGSDAVRVAERIRTHIEQVAFPGEPGGSPRQVTLSVGGVSFPRDGYNDAVLLSRAQAHLEEASKRGGPPPMKTLVLDESLDISEDLHRLLAARGTDTAFVCSPHELQLAEAA